MKYPSLVYKDGGDHARPDGTYSYRKIESDADLKAALSLGWHETLSDAIAPKKASKQKKTKVVYTDKVEDSKDETEGE